MTISLLLNDFLDDLVDFKPMSLGQIVWFTKAHKNFVKICMLARNSSRSAKYFLKQCESLNTENEISDIQLSALIVIIGEIENQGTHNMYDALVSRTSKAVGNSYWSRGMATSYLLLREVTCETIRKSA
jgi:predicted RNA-binding protein with EMAP domain